MAKINKDIEMAEIRNELKHVSKSQDELKLEFKESSRSTDIKLDKLMDILQTHINDETKLRELEKEAINKKFKEQEKENNEKYADKRTETIVWFVLFAFISAAIGTIWYVITNYPK